MKTVIVDIKDGYAAVLSEDGCIEKIKNKNYEIGQVIEMNKEKFHKTRKIAICSALAAMVALSGGVTVWAYETPYSYVSLDVNPSIQYSVNRFNRVISVQAVNSDGEEILNEIQLDDLENKKIEDAVSETVDQINEEGYFDGNTEGGIVIATSGKDLEASEVLAEELQENIENKVEEMGENIEVEAISVGLERVQEAKALGVTPGKLNLVEKLQKSSANPDSIALEEWLNKPVKEIMSAIKENKKAEIEKKKNQDNAETSEEATTEDVQPTNEIDIEKNVTVDEPNNNKTKEAEEKAITKSQTSQEKPVSKTEKPEEKSTDKGQSSEKGNSNNGKPTEEKDKNNNNGNGKNTGNDSGNNNGKAK